MREGAHGLGRALWDILDLPPDWGRSGAANCGTPTGGLTWWWWNKEDVLRWSDGFDICVENFARNDLLGCSGVLFAAPSASSLPLLELKNDLDKFFGILTLELGWIRNLLIVLLPIWNKCLKCFQCWRRLGLLNEGLDIGIGSLEKFF